MTMKVDSIVIGNIPDYEFVEKKLSHEKQASYLAGFLKEWIRQHPSHTIISHAFTILISYGRELVHIESVLLTIVYDDNGIIV